MPDLLDQGSTSYGYLNDHTGRIELTDYFSGTTTATEGTAGDVNGYLTDTKVEQGKADLAPALLSKIQYFAHSAQPPNGTATVYPVGKNIVYRNGTSSCTDPTNCEETDYSYTWLMISGRPTTRIQSRTIKPPVVLLDSTGQNGPGTVDVYTTYYDNWGREIWSRDSINAPSGAADGYITYTEYDPQSGAIVKTIRDVDMTRTSDFQNAPYVPVPGGTTWTSPPGTRLHLITQYQVDALGRVLRRTDPAGTVTIYDYKDTNHEVRAYPGWTGTAPTGPTRITRDDRTQSPSYVEISTATTPPQPDPVTGQPAGGEAIQMGGVQTLKRTYMSAGGQVVNADAYFSFTGMTNYPADTGTINTNFYRTSYTYDTRGRRNQTTYPTNTIMQTDYDGRNRVIDQKVGTVGTSMTMVAQYVYDQATVGGAGGIGDGNLTQVTRFPGDGTANRVDQFFYDWRDRPVAGKWGVKDNSTGENDGTHRPIVYLTYDNLSEITSAEQYDGDGYTLTTSGGVPAIPSQYTNTRRARVALLYDNQQRIYQVNLYSINQNDGTLTTTNPLYASGWYDHRGNLIKVTQPGGLVTKGQYDGIGRITTLYTTDDIANPTWADASVVTANNVLRQVETTYDGNNNVTFVVDRERFHNETTLGALGTPATAPLARVSYVASYYDAANRLTTVVDAGTNAGSTYSRPSTPDPRTNPVLRTDYAYNASGWLQDTTDPLSLVTRTLYDRLGRATSVIEDYTDGNPTNTSNRKTAFTYDGDNNLLTYTAVLPTTQQQTVYAYGVTTTNCGTTGSCINSNDLLHTVTYPGLTPTESYTYNAVADVTSFTDRNNTLHNYTFDMLGRLTADGVTIPGGSQVDGTVTKLGYSYDTGDRPYQLTSYRPDGTVFNQVQRGYNGLGQLTNDYQSHSGAVVVGTTPQVQYAYSVMMGGNHSRLTSITYPNTSPVRTLTYKYDGTTLDDSISRLTSIKDGGTTLENYVYLGLNTVVKRGHPEPGIDLTYIAQSGDLTCAPACDGGDQYTGLDRFGRVIDQRWIPTSSPQNPTDRFKYTYDQGSNRLTRTNLLRTQSHDFDESYSYDNFNQLTNFTRASHTQTWTLDPLGNWTQLNTDVGNQTRGNNTQNQITSLTGTNQYATWVAPTYDNNGNTTHDQLGSALTYDAWNRLFQYSGGSSVSYAYDALGRRISETRGANVTDLYYSAAWQVVEERTGANVTQYVWSPVYVDALIERDSGGQRLYVQQDGNWNVTAVVDSTGAPKERYAYDPYGQPTFLDPATWATLASSAFAWLYLHQGGRRDGTTGLYYFRNRDYSPTLGRWMQQDPLSYVPGDSNLYRFVGDEPTRFTDPKGLDREFTGPPLPNFPYDPTQGPRPGSPFPLPSWPPPDDQGPPQDIIDFYKELMKCDFGPPAKPIYFEPPIDPSGPGPKRPPDFSGDWRYDGGSNWSAGGGKFWIGGAKDSLGGWGWKVEVSVNTTTQKLRALTYPRVTKELISKYSLCHLVAATLHRHVRDRFHRYQHLESPIEDARERRVNFSNGALNCYGRK